MKISNLSKIIAFAACVSALSLSGCSGSNGSSGSSTGVQTEKQADTNVGTPLSFDHMTTIPSINGTVDTVIIARNTSTNETIDDIVITANNSGVTGGSGKLSAKNRKLKSSISSQVNQIVVDGVKAKFSLAPGQARTIHIHGTGSGSVAFHGTGTVNGQEFAVSELANYGVPHSTNKSLPSFTSPLNVATTSGSTEHVLAYIANLGNTTTVKIRSNALNVAPGQADATIGANSAIAIPVTIKAASTSQKAELTVISPQGSSTQAVGVTPSNQPFVQIGQLAAFDSTQSQSGYVVVTNSGSSIATISAPVSSDTSLLTIGTGLNSCGATLDAGNMCYVYFNLSRVGVQGSVPISISYDGGNSTAITVNFFNSLGAVRLAYTVNPSSLIFAATQESSAVITVTNFGGESAVLGQAAPHSQPANGSTSIVNGSDSCSNQTISAAGGTCSFTVKVQTNSLVTTSSYVWYTLSYNNESGNASASIAPSLPYTTTSFTPLVVLSSASLQTVADNRSNTQQTIWVQNVGANPTPATIAIQGGFTGATPNDGSLTQQSTNCGGLPTPNTLGLGESCSIVLQLGPTTQTLSAAESGTAILTVNYTGQQVGFASSATSNIDWSLGSNSQNLSITRMTSTSTGNGAATPFALSGATGGTVTLTLTLTNQGTDTVTIPVNGIQHRVNPFFWTVVEPDACSGIPVAVGSSCTIQYTSRVNDLSAYNLLGLGIINVTSASFATPSVTYTSQASNSQFVQQVLINDPSIGVTNGTTVNVSPTFAGLSLPTPVLSNGRLTVSNSWNNYAGYAPIIVVTKFEDIFDWTTAPVSTPGGACTATIANGEVTQTCTLDTAAAIDTPSMTYTVKPGYLDAGAPNVFINGSMNEVDATGQIVINNQPNWSFQVH